MKYTRFRDIPSFTRAPSYQVDYSWRYLKEYIDGLVERGLQLNPDFQRGHVWTEPQQIAFVEFCLRGGESARHVYFNFPGFSRGYDPDPTRPEIGEFVCVDGLQRLTAAMRFLNNEIPAFGTLYHDFADKLHMNPTMRIHINNLTTRAEVLQWYLEFNSGGTVHTEEELARVRTLLLQEVGGI